MRSLLVVAMVLSASSLPAQARHATSRGSVQVAGSAEFSRERLGSGDQSFTLTSTAASPALMFLVRDRIAFGAAALVGRVSGDDGSTTRVSAGPALRYYLAPPDRRTQPYLEGRVGVGRVSASSTFQGQTTDNSATTTTFGGSAGLLWMFARQVGLSGEAYVDRESGDDFVPAAGDGTRTVLGVRFGVAAFFIR